MRRLDDYELNGYVQIAIAAYGREHEYTRVDDFAAHKWVKEAMQLAYDSGFNDGYNAGAED